LRRVNPNANAPDHRWPGARCRAGNGRVSEATKAALATGTSSISVAPEAETHADLFGFGDRVQHDAVAVVTENCARARADDEGRLGGGAAECPGQHAAVRTAARRRHLEADILRAGDPEVEAGALQQADISLPDQPPAPIMALELAIHLPDGPEHEPDIRVEGAIQHPGLCGSSDLRRACGLRLADKENGAEGQRGFCDLHHDAHPRWRPLRPLISSLAGPAIAGAASKRGER
jgi:hypothetical protein